MIAPKPVNIHDTVALILCSSGTTGLPKGVELTHENVLVCVNHLKITAVVTDIPADELVFLSVIPWFHSYGCVTLISLVCLGFKSVVIPKFEEKLFLSCIQVSSINPYIKFVYLTGSTLLEIQSQHQFHGTSIDNFLGQKSPS